MNQLTPLQHNAQNIVTLCCVNPTLLANRTDKLNTLLIGLAVCIHGCNPAESESDLEYYLTESVCEIKSIMGGIIE